MRRHLRDLWLGVRLALSGGTDAVLRAVLTAFGVAFGVALLLFAASVPNMVSAHNARLQARVASLSDARVAHSSLLAYSFDVSFRGSDVGVVALQRTGAHPPLPPGVDRIPRPGTMLVSPALDRLLHSAAGAELARRLRARVVGTIADAGLSGPAELYAYRGALNLSARGGSSVLRFGQPAISSAQTPLITLLVIMMVAALLLPVGVFVATASRFGTEARNQRLAALRLLGLDRAGTARVAAGEALLGALAGVVLGVLGFVVILRPLIPHTDIAGVSVFSQDIKPSPALAALALVLVPVTAVCFALLAMRQVAIEPLGVNRRGTPPRRRLAWRLAMPALGFILLLGLVGSSGRLASTTGEAEASAGVVLVLIGVCALLPWAVEAAVIRAAAGAAGSGPVSWLLAIRRLRLDHGTSGRVVGAIGLAVAGAIALQTVFSGAERSALRAAAGSRTGVVSLDPVRGVVQINHMFVDARDAAAVASARLSRVAGVHDLLAVGSDPRVGLVSVAPCSMLAKLVSTNRCGADSAFILDSAGGLRAGRPIPFGTRGVRLPAGARSAVLRPAAAAVAGFVNLGPVLVAPGAAARMGLRPRIVFAAARLGPHAGAGLRDAVARIDPLAQVTTAVDVSSRIRTLTNLRRVLTAGAAAVLLVIGASLLVSVAEQLRERRRVLAVMAAFGTRGSTLAGSVLWQTALPIALGLALAIVIGAALGAVLMKIVNLPISFDWGSIALLTGAGLAVVVAVTGLTLPILRRQIGAEALRAE
jgi:hypothetical protein